MSKIKDEVPYGKLIIHELVTDKLTNSKRTIRVWLAPYYRKNKKGGYPVLYMHDGQNLFQDSTSYVGEWEVDETLTRLAKNKEIKPMIVVGIDSTDRRYEELSYLEPKKLFLKQKKDAIKQHYAEFVVEELKPFIDKTYNTNPDVNIIGGSSMGGIMSFTMAMAYPDVFSYALCFTPAGNLFYQKDIANLCKNAINNAKSLPKLYFEVGYAEKLEVFISEFTNFIVPFLLKNGYPEELIRYDFIKEARHNEKDWARIFPEAIKWLGVK
jgi:predicted alpha/beta superfamily hydrolase